MSITECHNLYDIMTSRSIVILNMSKNHAFLVVQALTQLAVLSFSSY